MPQCWYVEIFGPLLLEKTIEDRLSIGESIGSCVEIYVWKKGFSLDRRTIVGFSTAIFTTSTINPGFVSLYELYSLLGLSNYCFWAEDPRQSDLRTYTYKYEVHWFQVFCYFCPELGFINSSEFNIKETGVALSPWWRKLRLWSLLAKFVYSRVSAY